jgi:hypothetical protein
MKYLCRTVDSLQEQDAFRKLNLEIATIQYAYCAPLFVKTKVCIFLNVGMFQRLIVNSKPGLLIWFPIFGHTFFCLRMHMLHTFRILIITFHVLPLSVTRYGTNAQSLLSKIPLYSAEIFKI